ncbi:MAG TPA: glycosyltransferase family 1 protein [Candidatus Moranbacteria bacterium]|nr:glycosyltransferase family 1 protein [Candidatus Moranbacteria bacterium]
MRIGINASFARKQNTGIGQVTANFLKKLAEFSISNSQFSNNKNKYFIYLEEKLPKGFKLPKNFKQRVFLPKYKRDDIFRAIWWQKFLLPKKVQDDKCDVFLSMFQCATVMPKNIKHLMIVHDIILNIFPKYLNNWRKKYFWSLSKKAIRKADKIIAVSHRTEKDLIQHLGIDAAKISVAYIDVDEIYKKEISEEESQRVLKKYKLKPGYILAGGGLEVRKNIEGALKAYKILQDKYGQSGWVPPLVVYGKLMPELKPLVTDAEKVAEELEIKKQVKFLGCVSQADLPYLYRNASVFVYPSLYEGFGMPILEAMNQGTPVVTSKVSSLPEVGSDAVLYCDPERPEDIAMVVKNILNNNHLKAALSMKGRERATHFSWEKFVGKVINILKDIN